MATHKPRSRLLRKNLKTGKISQGDYVPQRKAVGALETARKTRDKNVMFWLEPEPDSAPASK